MEEPFFVKVIAVCPDGVPVVARSLSGHRSDELCRSATYFGRSSSGFREIRHEIACLLHAQNVNRLSALPEDPFTLKALDEYADDKEREIARRMND